MVRKSKNRWSITLLTKLLLLSYLSTDIFRLSVAAQDSDVGGAGESIPSGNDIGSATDFGGGDSNGPDNTVIIE